MVRPHSRQLLGDSRRDREGSGAWLVVGAGRCGLQLARSMAAASVPLAGLLEASAQARRRARRCLPGVPVLGPADALPAARGVLLAVPDQRLGSCAAELSGRLGSETRVVVHTSGVQPAAVLEVLRGRGRALASLHPLMSFARGDGPLLPLAGVAAALEGDTRGVRLARTLARRLGLATVVIAAADKPLYHALAALAANMASAMVAVTCEELARIGPSRGWARRALAPLVLEAVRNVLATGDLSRLTGPLVRGDARTVRTHLASLPPGLAAAYESVARLAVAELRREGRITPRNSGGGLTPR
ncbi:MAG: DUF2520 domain-containing protein [Thermoanaerobaculaceae bacterium]